MSSGKNFVGIRRGYPKSRLGTARCCASIVHNSESMSVRRDAEAIGVAVVGT
jgi:hypothetical protein